VLARGVLEMAEHAMRLENDYADLLARVEFVEKRALAEIDAAELMARIERLERLEKHALAKVQAA
jgi:hypothetical protein